MARRSADCWVPSDSETAHAWWIAIPLGLAETYSLSESGLYALTMWSAGRRPGLPTPPTGRTVNARTMTDDPYPPYYPENDAVHWVGISLYPWRPRRGDHAAGLWRMSGGIIHTLGSQ